MNNINVIEGDFAAGKSKFGIVVARFNGFIVEQLLAGAIDALSRHGVDEKNMEIVRVPGAFEMPLTVKTLAQNNKYDAIIALGCVIRGATPHFDYVAGECAKGVGSASLEHSMPIAFGVLTTDTIEQAIERAGTKAGNKGADAAMVALEMVSLMGKLGK